MFNDKKNLIITGAALIIVALVFILVRRTLPTEPATDPYLEQLKKQNRELAEQLNRLKQNYVDIGLADSIQSHVTDSLITASSKRVNDLRQEMQAYRAALEEMKTREWKRLTDAQKTREIEDALNYLKRNEK